MKNLKKIALLLTVVALLAIALVGCGETENPASNPESKTETKTIVIGATPAPHAEILEQVKDAMAEKGYTLDIKVYEDYIIPNTACEDGELDANYFQHKPYLEQFNEENGTHLVTVAPIHYEPYGIYVGSKTSLDDLADGDQIAVPNDATNEARALQLLAAQGLFTLKEGVGLTATKNDIVDNPKNLDIVEMEAALIPGVKDEFAVAVINGNYAIEAGLKVADALATEDKESEAAQTFANYIVVKEGNEDNEGIKALVEVLQTEEIRSFIEGKYEGAVVPMF